MKITSSMTDIDGRNLLHSTHLWVGILWFPLGDFEIGVWMDELILGSREQHGGDNMIGNTSSPHNYYVGFWGLGWMSLKNSEFINLNRGGNKYM